MAKGGSDRAQAGRDEAAEQGRLHEAADAWLRARAGHDPQPLRRPVQADHGPRYETALRLHVLPDSGGMKLRDVRRNDVQDLADRMLAAGADSLTVRNAVMPLRVIFRRALNRGDVAINPTPGLELPAVRGRRDRIVSPDEAAALSTPSRRCRALWATALYAGLRHGELRALRWEDVDLAEA